MSALSPVTSDSEEHESSEETISRRTRWTFSDEWEYAVTQVFLPGPHESFADAACTEENDHILARAVCAAAHTYSDIVGDVLKPQWRCIAKMLHNLEASVLSRRLDKNHIISRLCEMQTGDIFAFFNRVQDAAVIFRKRDQCTLYESFQTSWDSDSTVAGSYPEWAIEIPDEMFHNQYFQSELVNFLLYRDEIPKFYGFSSDGTTYPKLLTSILRSVGHDTNIPRIIKRVHNQVGSRSRSPLWLLIKVAIQTSLGHSDAGRISYKIFMLRFMCSLGKAAFDTDLSSDILHAISAKILRRIRKLGSSAPNWLCDMVLKANASLQQILEARWKEVEASQPPPPLWKPSLLDLDSDTELSLTFSRKYIRNCLMNLDPGPLRSPFHPKYLPRGTLNDFLSSNGTFFEEAYLADPYVTLYDVERAVEEGIDDWVASITDMDQACIQLEILMRKYLSSASHTYKGNPEHISVTLLTVIELWIALDKLVPIFADYSPEIPEKLLHLPLLHKPMNLHRLCRAHLYLSARHSQSIPGQSIFSDAFSKETFPVDVHVDFPQNVDSQYFRDYIKKNSPIVPSDIAIFELRCPVSLHIWRSATARLLGSFPYSPRAEKPGREDKKKIIPLAYIPQLQPYLVNHWTSPATGRVYLTCFAPEGLKPWEIFCNISDYQIGSVRDGYFAHQLQSNRTLHKYINATSHVSNGVLATQAECPDDLSPSEFIAFGHLRSGGSLQWTNILRELRSRTLNFRRHDTYILFAQAASQLGPLDVETAEWVWHQELQESSFCSALLDELENLFVDVAARSLDGVMIGIISFLLTRLLASCCYEDISGRAIGLLQQVRTKTFEWVRELAYDLIMAPTSTERSKLLRDMATTCRSTFDVGPAILHKLLHSAVDVEALLSCAIWIHANDSIHSDSISEYSKLLLERDRRLSFTLEGILRDVVGADVSDRGIDLAVRNVWPGYRPGTRGWQSLPTPNSHWLTCGTAADGNGRSQIVHLNLLDGKLLVDGQPINGLPREIRKHALYKRIFGDQGFLAIPSDLPGMDLTILAMISEHRASASISIGKCENTDIKPGQVHFSLKGRDLVIKAQHQDAADILEVIPSANFMGDLPPTFVHDHVHWLNLSTSMIDIRPLEKIWKQSLEGWRIYCGPGKNCMYKGRECIVDIRSPTWEMISNRLECLRFRDAKNLVITTFPFDTLDSSHIRRLSVLLPRYGLSFIVNEDGDLESRDFKNMVYDENQCIGTLFGLRNRLVLRSKAKDEEELVHRSVIIPDGRIDRINVGHHACITIETRNPRPSGRSVFTDVIEKSPSTPVAYHIYEVGSHLGCLTDRAGWRSKMYLAHLHARTSVNWRPDPLTGKTGIQEALRLFRSAGCRSILELDTRHDKPGYLPSDLYKPYPHLNFAIQEIEYLIDREKFLRTKPSGQFGHPQRPQPHARAVSQTAYLFPFDVVGPMSTSSSVKHPKFSEAEDLACTVSLAVYHWVVNAAESVPESLQGETKHADASITTPVWANRSLLPPVTVKIDNFLEASKLDKITFKDTLNRCVPPLSVAQVEVLLQEAKEARQRFRLLFLLPTTVYRQRYPQTTFLSILVGLAKRSPLKNPPRYANFRPCYGYSPSRDTLKKGFVGSGLSISQDDEELDNVMGQWSMALSAGTAPLITLDARQSDNTRVQKILSSCYYNFRLKEDLVNRLPGCEIKSHSPSDSAQVQQQAQCHTPWQATLGQLFCDRPAPVLPAPHRLRCSGPQALGSSSNGDTSVLNQLFASLRLDKTDPSFQQQYISRLHSSARHARETPCMTQNTSRGPSIEELRQHFVQCKADYVASLTVLKDVLGPRDNPLWQALARSGQWPQITPNTLFACLASTSPIKPPGEWKDSLVSLALLLVELQRARRLFRFALDNLKEELYRELANEGCDGWNAEEYPDWLLIQLQGNFVIREFQADVARKLISPASGQNTTMQVNMGEGKSSVILPISAATLADGNQLVRVIVPKTLSVQMFRLLVGRLGGLVNRPVYHLPFSRSLTGEYNRQQFESIRELMAECMHHHGILLVQPEHILSLKLTGIQKQLPRHLCNDDNVNEASVATLLELQRWVQSHARDILDESDEVLHPRFQLIYTVGLQRHVEGYPDRWTITQQILAMVKRHALSLSHDLPNSIEYELDASGSFPRIRILRASDARQRLISLIVDDVVNGHLPNFNLRDIDNDRRLRAAVRAFISSKDVAQRTVQLVQDYAQQSILWDGILLLRGLLANGILLFALGERRWCVDYGLCPQRTMLAVPYRAKAVPAPKAEFGHPDVAIALTCLSYYYGGLTEEQLRVSFEILQDQNDPSTEYADWLRDYDPGSIPECIQDISNVNIKSSEQWDRHLFPLFARNQGAVDFYLSRVVFPKEAREFPWKLAASSWDLAETRERPITGFSGTNDCQDLLPTSITQHDPDHQRGATARVLTHLLQPENNSYSLISRPNGNRRTTLELLKLVVDQEPEVRVFLDIGAQILDFSNYQVAKAWLGLSSECDGAVYFNEDDEPMVLTRDGNCRSLITSPLAQLLDRCIVYLDDAHTRGTDFKFPSGFRAAVTLGPKVTKDRLVQGCMRMRKLGHGHSITFLAPLEVDGSIRAVAAKEDQNTPITTTDILRWTIHETWTDIQERAPYWAQQGISHISRYEAWTRFCRDELTREQLADVWLQPELKSLADLYAPFRLQDGSSCLTMMDEYPEIQQHCIDLGVVSLPEAQMEEEQEREVCREIEREREVQQPPKATPAVHSVHPDVVTFVKTGVVPLLHASSAFQPVFTTLEGSFVAASDSAHVWSPLLLATEDFRNTIAPASCQGRAEQYLRPVQWVLSGKRNHDRILVLLSPFEADRLMQDVRASEHVHLHAYTPRTSKRMRPADDLTFYSIPPVPDAWTPPWELIDQLNVFAGQLYLRDLSSYLWLRGFLGIQSKDVPKTVGTAVRRNRVTPSVLAEIGQACTGSPLPLVMALLAIRRRGLPFSETHMGRMLQGQALTEEDFEGLGARLVRCGRGTSDGRDRARTDHRDVRAPLPRVPSVIMGGVEDGAVTPTEPLGSLPVGLRRGRVDTPDVPDSGRPQKRLRTGCP